MADEPTHLPKDLKNTNELLVFLRDALYDRPLSGKRSSKSTTWKLVQAALLWSDFQVVIYDFVTTATAFQGGRFDYTPCWEPALTTKDFGPLSYRSRLSYSKILREVWPSYRGGPRVAAPEFAQAELQQTLANWEVKNAFLVRSPHKGTWPPPWARTNKMPETNTPCLFLRGRLVLPSWGV